MFRDESKEYNYQLLPDAPKLIPTNVDNKINASLVSNNVNSNTETELKLISDMKGYHPLIKSQLVLKNTLGFIEFKEMVKVAESSHSFFTAVRGLTTPPNGMDPIREQMVTELEKKVSDIIINLQNITRSCECCCTNKDNYNFLIERLTNLRNSLSSFDLEKFNNAHKILVKYNLSNCIPGDKNQVLRYSLWGFAEASLVFTCISAFTLPCLAPVLSGSACCGLFYAGGSVGDVGDSHACEQQLNEVMKKSKELYMYCMKIQPLISNIKLQPMNLA